jgi:hypothetical protein
MEAYKFRHVGVGHSQSQAGHVLVTSERQGVPGVVLSTKDAQRLCDELPEQVRIALLESSSPS